MLKIYNTLSRQKETFKPINEGRVGMYVCGMTVYDYCHLGHARVLVGFDIISRYLRFSGYDVNYVRNITDIDDKILRRADENGENFEALTERFITAMHEDEHELGVQKPTSEPRATAFIEQIISMVQTLIEKGYAYAADNGDVYYSVTQFDDYGALSGKKLDELITGASERNTIETDKKDERDFALWKRAQEGEVSWDSPWGKGRPGWHIECSAMSTCCLGETFDIHGGGPDLPFPHHENEIAQSEAATGKKYVNYWMHAGAVRVDNEKMSKSLGNFFTIRDILAKYPAEVVRFFLISSHYRSSINYSEQSLKEAKAGLQRFYQCLQNFEQVEALSEDQLKQSKSFADFTAAMDDDFNVREALAVMYGLVKTANSADEDAAVQAAAELKAYGKLLGILQMPAQQFLQQESAGQLAAADIENLIAQRQQAKLDKDYAKADSIRDQLKEQGVELLDSPEGTTWQRL